METQRHPLLIRVSPPLFFTDFKAIEMLDSFLYPPIIYKMKECGIFIDPVGIVWFLGVIDVLK